jgi:hypothetical protein
MSKFWPIDSLKTKVEADTINTLSNFDRGYIAFQGKLAMKRHMRSIIEQLRNLHNETKLPILLIPIGLAYGHENQIFLDSLANKVHVPVQTLNSANIFDIMYSIGSSDLFIGTSLHGNVTAMSYSVNHMGFGRIPKLDQFLKHWDVGPNKQTGCVKPSEICESAIKILNNTDKNLLVENASRLVKLADKNLTDIAKLISDNT